ncbi:hypothetical protein [uncultured Sphingomonas sp.]|uniref:hypothetical protein n=1 Tax=uncultured Sphingomonas sp. TaxID=158754 RepID=UPI0025D19222|nr:hypothetical protein [uncultured Sphingomonas sp.]
MIRTVKAQWRGTILICGKCEKKLRKTGFGPDGDTRLSKLLGKRGGKGKGRKAELGVIQVGCLKVCPKNAVVVVDAARSRDWLIVSAGTPVDVVEQRLGLTRPSAIAAE